MLHNNLYESRREKSRARGRSGLRQRSTSTNKLRLPTPGEPVSKLLYRKHRNFLLAAFLLAPQYEYQNKQLIK